MAESKKKGGGMLGKHHPKDETMETALGWAHRMRKKYPPPDGCKILVKFPEGPTGGTWGKTKGSFRAIAKNGKAIGTFPRWQAAREALGNAPRKAAKKAGKRKAANVNGVTSDLMEKMTGPEGKSIMLAVADQAEEKAQGLTNLATALRSAAEAL